MRLEMKTFDVRDVRLADRTGFHDGILSIAPKEVQDLMLSSGDFEDVGVEVVRPGEPVRLIHVMDAVEPRHKPAGGSTFPGFVGPQQQVGEGSTHRLTGMAIISVGEPVAGEPTYWREAVVDMAGPGAEASPFGSTLNVVLDFKPAAHYFDQRQVEDEAAHSQLGSSLAQRYNRAVRVAELRVADYLARTTAERQSDALDVYELGPVRDALPRVAYFFQCGGLCLYGERSESILPTLIHPNEILDGGLVNVRSNSHASYRECTYLNLNHAIIRELHRRHGEDLNFVGVIIHPGAADSLSRKERMANYAAKVARMLGIQGACLSYLGGGHACVDFMLICQKCEQAGIRTVLVMPEAYGTPEDPGFVHTVPEAVSIVSTGRATQRVNLPAANRVIGGERFFDLPDAPAGPLSIPLRYVYGSCSSTGFGRLMGTQY